jgi:biopolymer transport protein ExbD
MQAAGRKSKQLFNEINITPLTDIFLVLLIIMMVVAPLMQQVRQDIKPPPLQNGSQVEQNKVTVEVTKDGAIFIQGKETPLDSLTTTLQEQETLLLSKTGGQQKTEAVAGSPAAAAEKGVIIRADKATRSGQVLKIFEAARDAGFNKVIIAGEALEQARQNQLEQQAPAPASTTTEPQAAGGAQ